MHRKEIVGLLGLASRFGSVESRWFWPAEHLPGLFDRLSVDVYPLSQTAVAGLRHGAFGCAMPFAARRVGSCPELFWNGFDVAWAASLQAVPRWFVTYAGSHLWDTSAKESHFDTFPASRLCPCLYPFPCPYLSPCPFLFLSPCPSLCLGPCPFLDQSLCSDHLLANCWNEPRRCPGPRSSSPKKGYRHWHSRNRARKQHCCGKPGLSEASAFPVASSSSQGPRPQLGPRKAPRRCPPRPGSPRATDAEERASVPLPLQEAHEALKALY